MEKRCGDAVVEVRWGPEAGELGWAFLPGTRLEQCLVVAG